MRILDCLSVLASALLLAGPAGATTVTLSQEQLLAAEEITGFFGGNGQILSRTADGDGVLFEIEGGTIDYGKVAARLRLGGADLTAYSDFGLHVDVVSAPNPIELNAFIQTGITGTIFHEDVPGEFGQGAVFDSVVPLLDVEQLDQTFALGFQYFTASGVIDPLAQTVLLRISPLAGAEYAVPASDPNPMPEPTTGLLMTLGLGALCRQRHSGRRRRRHGG